MYLHHANYMSVPCPALITLSIKLGTSGLEVSESIPSVGIDSVGVRVSVAMKNPVMLEDRESELELLE